MLSLYRASNADPLLIDINLLTSEFASALAAAAARTMRRAERLEKTEDKAIARTAGSMD